MGRLNTMTDLAASSSIISANHLRCGEPDADHDRQSHRGALNINAMGQLTHLVSGTYIGTTQPSLNIYYDYSFTQNNGKIAQQRDGLSGEQVVYAYDALNRLASAHDATNNTWGQSYAYDGFGNLTTQAVTVGTAPALA